MALFAKRIKPLGSSFKRFTIYSELTYPGWSLNDVLGISLEMWELLIL